MPGYQDIRMLCSLLHPAMSRSPYDVLREIIQKVVSDVQGFKRHRNSR
jgi:hypothetical protein